MSEIAPATMPRPVATASPSPTASSPSVISPKPILVAKTPPDAGSATPTPGPATASAGVVKLQVKKKYVLPPRPKPGRKPSAETPLNKRKAQNREAQRAFRERRAVAIQDLEKKLNEESRRHASDYKNMTSMIQQLIQENELLKNRMAQQPPPASFPPPMSPATSAMSPGQSPYDAGFSPSQFTYMMVASPVATTTATAAAQNVGRSPLDMLDKVLDEKLPDPSTPKRSPEQLISSSRRPSIVANVSKGSHTKPCGGPPPCDGLALTNTNWAAPAVPLHRRLSSLETDFTQRFKKTQPRVLPQSPSYVFSPEAPSPGFERPEEKERCGFCTDNTPCVCAEAAARERANMSDIETLGDNLPLVTDLSIQTPSFDEQAQMQPAPAQIGVKECSGNPGTCTQCQQDPMSTLFCATLAAKGAAAPANGTFIPAQAAYQTLSRHERFNSADFSQLVSSLQTRGTQVEVNSVAKVLRMLDGRLYSG